MTQKLTTEEFIRRAREVHGSKWDYSKTKYTRQLDRVEIVCPVHGSFYQFPTAHVHQGQGCPACGCSKASAQRTSSQEHFLGKLGPDYKRSYDLTEAVYAGLYTTVAVVCREHGRFKVKPADMYKGVGCPTCSSSGFKVGIPAHLYVLKSEAGPVKLGITNRKPSDRARRVSVASGHKHKVVYEVKCAQGREALDMETELLEDLREHYANPEDAYEGHTESFIGLAVEVLIEKIESIRGRK